jgi:hypothetical protein
MPEEIDIPYQLVCEGKADEVFFRRLLADMGKVVHVQCPKLETDGAMGKEAIRRRLEALQTKFGFITRVVIAVDSDDDPATAFTAAQREIEQANLANPHKRYPSPATSNTIATLAGSPDTAIVLVPDDAARGCLDTILLPSFETMYAGDTLRCVDEFCRCTTNPVRGHTKDSKLRLRALIAATQARNPGVSLSFLLEEKNCPIPITDASFSSLRTRLATLFP